MGNIVQTTVETEKGEILVTINLNLSIKLDSNTPSEDVDVKEKQILPKKLPFERPVLEENDSIINFGKNV